VIVTYIRLLFFPAYQNIDYDYPIYTSLFALPVLLSFLFLAALFGIAVWLLYKSRLWARGYRHEEKSGREVMGHGQSAEEKKKEVVLPIANGLLPAAYLRLMGFGILWFFITLSVESSIIPIPMVIDEYRAYLPSVGFFIAIIAGVVLLLRQNSRFTIHDSRSAKIVVAAFMTLAAILAAATHARNILWKDKISLWEDVVAKSPNSPRGYNNLGIAYNEKGMIEKAIAMYEQCIKLNPYQKDVRINLAVAYAMSKRFEKAIEEFTKAIAITPRHSILYANLALAYAQIDRFDKAAEAYAKSVELDPYNSSAYHGLGTAYMRLGRVEDALHAYTKYVSLSPRDPEAYRNRALAYAEKGDLHNARGDFEKACSLGNSQSCESLKKIQ
jgi:Flp pilus assembly protein TadD